MADIPPNDRVGSTDAEEARPITPRWVRVFGAALVVIALLFFVMHLRGGHGPGRHLAPRGNAR